jgi:hypothetical protein
MAGSKSVDAEGAEKGKKGRGEKQMRAMNVEQIMTGIRYLVVLVLHRVLSPES